MSASVPQHGRRLGVIGWPVRHSRSPAMHNAALAELGLGDIRYSALPVPPERFEATVRALGSLGFLGVNVTIPHKEAALALADRASDRARAIGAANTLTFERDGSVSADNTDAPGLLAAMPAGARLDGVSTLVLGAGGSARAAVWALVGAGADVRVHNRTHERAVALCDAVGGTAVGDAAPAQLLVNCTSVGLEDADALPCDDRLLDHAAVVVDLVYRPGGTALVRLAAWRKLHVVDGLEILVRQGALSLERWLGRPAPIAVMRSAIADG